MKCLSKLPEGQIKKRFNYLIKKYPYTSRVEVFPGSPYTAIAARSASDIEATVSAVLLLWTQ
jgi:hypothetical protein